MQTLPDFLPGQLLMERGSAADYMTLKMFHYLPRRPATWAGVWRIRYIDAHDDRVVGVGVLSYPCGNSRLRNACLQRTTTSRAEMMQFANENIRCISRVVIHPQFRSLGLATALVRELIDQCPTRYTESVAMMARAHPFFEAAGMKRLNPVSPEDPLYFIHDKVA